MLLPRDSGPRESTALSVALTLSDDASGGLADIVKVREGYGTFNERSERFSSTNINSSFLDSH